MKVQDENSINRQIKTALLHKYICMYRYKPFGFRSTLVRDGAINKFQWGVYQNCFQDMVNFSGGYVRIFNFGGVKQ